MKVPLKVSWLSENNLLGEALQALKYKLVSSHKQGVTILVPKGPVLTTNGTRKGAEHHHLDWDDELLFTAAQLIELGFEPGRFEYCENCKKLKVDCNREQSEIYDRNHEVLS